MNFICPQDSDSASPLRISAHYFSQRSLRFFILNAEYTEKYTEIRREIFQIVATVHNKKSILE